MTILDLSKAEKATKALESGYVKVLTQQYQIALKDIDDKLKEIFAKYSVDGKMDITKMSVMDKNKVTRLTKVIDDINLDLNSLNRGRPQQLAGHLTSVYETNSTLTGEAINKASKLSINFGTINRDAIYQSVLTPLTNIALSDNAVAVRQQIQRTITQSIVQGQSYTDMAKGVQKALETNANNAMRIARTETGRVMGEARQTSFDKAVEKGVKLKKEWVATNDSRTRFSHRELDGQVVDSDKPFSIRGVKMMYPHDSSLGAGPEETINCRCTMKAVIELD